MEHPCLMIELVSVTLEKKTNFSNAEANKISYFHSNYRSDGASTSEARRIRRRSISITPEIGDDIVRLMLVSLFFLKE